MNKKNKILVGCLALLLALSVGYALFSDTITINGTATAKGSFDMVVTCEPGIDEGLVDIVPLAFADSNRTLLTEGGYENDTCSVVDDTVSYSADLKYPGAARYFTVKITNNGTIPAIPTEETYEYNFCNDADESGVIDVDECGYTGETYVSAFVKKMLPDNVVVAYAKPDGTILNIYDETSYTEEDALEVVDPATGAFKPGASMYIISTAFFSSDYGSDDGGSFLVTAGKTFTLTFTQPTTN